MAKKFTKAQANYHPSENPDFRCGNCIHFQPADETRGYGYCGLVLGKVSSEGVCKLWEPDPLQEPGDTIYERAKAYGLLTELRKQQIVRR